MQNNELDELFDLAEQDAAAFVVLALCALAIVVSCTVWMVQSIMYAIW